MQLGAFKTVDAQTLSTLAPATLAPRPARQAHQSFGAKALCVKKLPCLSRPRFSPPRKHGLPRRHTELNHGQIRHPLPRAEWTGSGRAALAHKTVGYAGRRERASKEEEWQRAPSSTRVCRRLQSSQFDSQQRRF
jgi:hypothetical protein